MARIFKSPVAHVSECTYIRWRCGPGRDEKRTTESEGGVALEDRFAPRRAIDRRSPLPLWAQVQADIERRLRRGEFSQAFPGEMDLVDQYGVSRQTIREALRRLRENGLLEAARGRAPKVADTEITQPQGALYSLFASVQTTGRVQRSIVRALDARADGTVAARLGLEESTPLIFLERIRLVDEEPLAMDRVWLPARIAAPLLESDFTQTSLYEELDRRCGVRLTGGQELVRAIVPTAAERVMLSIPETTAALAIERTGEVKGQSVEWRSTVVRGDRFSLLTDFTRPHGAVSMTVTGSQLLSREPQRWAQAAGRSGGQRTLGGLR